MLDAPNAAKFSIENLMKPSEAPKRFNPSPEPYLPYPGARTISRLYPIPAPVMSEVIGDQRSYQARYGAPIAAVPMVQHLPTDKSADTSLKRKSTEEEPRNPTDSQPKYQAPNSDFRDQILRDQILRDHRDQLIRGGKTNTHSDVQQHVRDSFGLGDQFSQGYREQISQHVDATYSDRAGQAPPAEFRDQIPQQRDTTAQVTERDSNPERRDQIQHMDRDNFYQQRKEHLPAISEGLPSESRPISPAHSETHSDAGAGDDGPRRKKSRTSFSAEQIAELERRFRNQKYLAPNDRSDLAEKLGLSDQQVKTWFQNRRMKDKRTSRDSADIPPAAMPPYTTSAPFTTGVPTCGPSGYAIDTSSPMPAGVPAGYPFTTASQVPFSEHPRLAAPPMYPVNLTSQRLLTPPMDSPGQQSGSPHPQTTSYQMLSQMVPPMTVSSPYMPRSPFPMMPI